jgi:hypothetical protein
MEITYSSEMSVDFQRTTRRYISENRTIRKHRCENLRSYKVCKVKMAVPGSPSNSESLVLCCNCAVELAPTYKRQIPPLSKEETLPQTKKHTEDVYGCEQIHVHEP